MTFVLVACPRDGCTKRHGVQAVRKASRSAADGLTPSASERGVSPPVVSPLRQDR